MEAKDTIFQCKNKLLFTFDKFREEEGDIDILGLKMSLQRVMTNESKDEKDNDDDLDDDDDLGNDDHHHDVDLTIV